MTLITHLLEQALALSPQERKELTKLLIDSLGDPSDLAPPPKTGAEIVAMLDTMDPIEFVDEHIEDPVAWVKAQRRKEAARLNSDPEQTHD